MRAHQPGSEPMDIPEVIPNPAVLPKEAPDPNKPAPAKPAENPEKVPANNEPPACEGSHWDRGDIAE